MIFYEIPQKEPAMMSWTEETKQTKSVGIQLAAEQIPRILRRHRQSVGLV